jgi:hypothetical protein
MTEAEYKAAHIELWQWLYGNPFEGKGDWPGWRWNDGQYDRVKNLCFACEVAVYKIDESENKPAIIRICNACPLDAATFKSCTTTTDGKYSIYGMWKNAKSIMDRQHYAAVIRDAWREIPND